MNEIRGNILDYIGRADGVCITTNGIVKSNGEAVMGAGVALAFKNRFPQLPKLLGSAITREGNVVRFLDYVQGQHGSKFTRTISFPTKHHWRDKSDIELIKESARQLVHFCDTVAPKASKIIIPRPGCGNGELNWRDVKEILSPMLDDRFYIIKK